jgi:NAD(P)H-dependent FMN reductase
MDANEQQPLVMPVVLGSIRPARRSERPARLLAERVAAAGHAGGLIDLRALDLPLHGLDPANEDLPSAVAWKQAMEAADAVVWLTPEYTHSFTAPIKSAIDYLHAELRRKPVAVCGLSSGDLGGSRAVEQLKLVLIELHAAPIRDSVYFYDARTLFDEQGQLTEPKYVTLIDEMLVQLAWYARALRWGRANLASPDRRRR